MSFKPKLAWNHSHPKDTYEYEELEPWTLMATSGTEDNDLGPYKVECYFPVIAEEFGQTNLPWDSNY